MIVTRRHRAFYVAAVASAASALLAIWLPPLQTLVISANTFFAIYLAMTFIALPKLTSAYLRKHAASSDEPEALIFLVTLGAVAAAVTALFLTINSKDAPDIWHLALSLVAVPLGWFTIHTMAALHYAHLYWQPATTSDGGTAKPRKPRGGLDFPGDGDPGGSDFLYFSYVIGMTAQTSDVGITSSTMRQVNLVHAVVSFFFNTVLVAAAVNAAVALAS